MTETATQPEPRAPTEFAPMLDLIDEFLARGGKSAHDLWSVLSALRGPDDVDESRKRVTTVHIRRKAFPKTTKEVEEGEIYMAPSLQSLEKFAMPKDESHFSRHIILAARVLGMERP